MTTHLTYKGMDSSEAVKAYLDERAKKLYKFLPPTVNLTVVLHKDRHELSADFTFHYAGEDFHAGKTSDDLYAAIDGAVDKLIEQLRRSKDRHHDTRGNEG